ncbi:DEAD/DEAH box helicase [Rubritalea spongiae]|uniref:ATP-dependent RNA helicase RhlE n=1 Tax=Rubritalea spongiae TaxID=430797 RepID=A0ABW5E189_9BACT
MEFSSLALSSPIQKAIAEEGYTEPSPIQAQAIPAVLDGKDVMAAAQTGTGKTAGFTLPLLEKLSKGQPARSNQVRALILTPTRELAAQVAESVQTYGKHLDLKSAVVFGGVKINPQMMKLRRGADILVATPGRLMDLYNQNAIKFNTLEVLVLDEADRMLDMGFIHEIKKLIAILPKQRQNLLFSATFSDEIRKLAKSIVRNPVEISVTPRNATADTVEQMLYSVDKSRRGNVLIRLIKENDWKQCLVFVRTKHGANRLARQLESKGVSSSAIHGDKSQGARTRALDGFKKGTLQVLVATDIAARGIDIDQLPQVVNFDLPDQPEDYVHRIGRTGRAGAAGQAISLVCEEQFPQLVDIENLIKKLIPRVELEGFVPHEVLPESKLGMRSPKRPAKKVVPRGNRSNRRGGPASNKGGKSGDNKFSGPSKKGGAAAGRRRGQGSMASQKRSSHNK